MLRKYYLALAIICLPFFLAALVGLLFNTELQYGQKTFIFVFCSMGMISMFEKSLRKTDKPILRSEIPEKVLKAIEGKLDEYIDEINDKVKK